jgi:hypothetical protein
MEALRHRLRFATGVNLTQRTYGTGAYGDGTLGEQASDPLTAARYLVIPWPSGFLSDPSWLYRQGDVTPPFKISVQADDGPLDYTGLAKAYLVLTNTDGASPTTPRQYQLSVQRISGADWLIRNWLYDDLILPGTYRSALVLTYNSGRRLTIPGDDRHNFVITPNSAINVTPQWGGAHWDSAIWSEEEFA